jgi:putative transposase
VDQWQEKGSVAQACRVLQVSRSGYYAAKANSQKDGSLQANIQEAFIHSSKTYGSRRIVKVLNTKGIKIGRCKVSRLMRQMNLSPVWKRKFKPTTDSTHTLPVAANILNRQFTPAEQNQAWVADITYIWTQSGWLYLAVILDLFSRKVVGWAMSVTMTADLVCRALVMAIGARRPLIGLIVHTDRGSQYASHDYQRLLKRYGLIGSMSRKGNCWDNAVAERFFLNLKIERVWQRSYANQLEAEKDIAQYIAGYYNCIRLHSACGYLSPIAYEQKMMTEKPYRVSEKT